MSDDCIDIERLGEVIELPAGHPDRMHSQTCPRCGSMLESYRLFTQAEPIAGSEVDGVRGALDAHIRRQAARWTPRGLSPAAPAAPWWRWLLRPLPMAVTAALVIAVGGLWRSLAPEPTVVRQDSAKPGAFRVDPAQVDAAGSIHLAWRPMEGADGYQVRIYGPDLSEIYRSANTPDTALTVTRTSLPADLPATLDLTWRVFALVRGDVLASSEPASISTR